MNFVLVGLIINYSNCFLGQGVSYILDGVLPNFRQKFRIVI